ncbi:uncharacterized protein B0I36DRAFT_352415 [Microdochium trichocladiopsis]|uniref:Uncharacterized protein n=1 Tax=Microdochium trichocladiopsis TaxID=1682393 RepID=A0A9P9BR59_9PEZI|nr:uncharacterized protein B0I36DRAFT_352415 [Microdochium trichocladiopsis]KAH7026577.1 hypothetical protein B0I36DRAFT_352415 [Microdochium trichocladiopsis]
MPIPTSGVPKPAETPALEDPFVDTEPANPGRPEVRMNGNSLLMLVITPNTRITVPGTNGETASTIRMQEYCQNASRGLGSFSLPRGSIINVLDETTGSYANIRPTAVAQRLLTTHAVPGANGPGAIEISAVDMAAIKAASVDAPANPLYFEDFVALNGQFFAGYTLPSDKVVNTANLQSIVIDGTAVVFHIVVAFTYFPHILDASFASQLAGEYDATTVAILLLGFYHNDHKHSLAADVVDKAQLRKLYKFWLELNPQLEMTLVDAVWDSFDEVVFSA